MAPGSTSRSPGTARTDLSTQLRRRRCRYHDVRRRRTTVRSASPSCPTARSSRPGTPARRRAATSRSPATSPTALWTRASGRRQGRRPAGAGSGGASRWSGHGPRGRIVAAGLRCDGGNCDFAPTRYTADGSLDPSFDSDGVVRTSFGPAWTRPSTWPSSPAGRSSPRVAAQRLGLRRRARPVREGRQPRRVLRRRRHRHHRRWTGDDQASGLELRGNGDVVVAGSTDNGTNLDLAVARYGS